MTWKICSAAGLGTMVPDEARNLDGDPGQTVVVQGRRTYSGVTYILYGLLDLATVKRMELLS